MSLSNTIKSMKTPKLKPAIVLGLDSSSKSIAISVYERAGDTVTLLQTTKTKFGDKDTMKQKLEQINAFIPAFLESVGQVDAIVIEQTIYIQSPQTSRILSYIVGHIWGKCLEYCDNVVDVPIMTWKAYIGYKNVTKKDIAAWEAEIGKAEAKKKAAYERKHRTMRLMREKIPGLEDIDDNDIMDAIAIGYWAVENVQTT